MPDYVHLFGAEEVGRAASRMQSAANDMQRAASSFEDSLQRHQRFMDDWLGRFEQILEQSRA